MLFSDERKIPARLPDLQKGRLGLGQGAGGDETQ